MRVLCTGFAILLVTACSPSPSGSGVGAETPTPVQPTAEGVTRSVEDAAIKSIEQGSATATVEIVWTVDHGAQQSRAREEVLFDPAQSRVTFERDDGEVQVVIVDDDLYLSGTPLQGKLGTYRWLQVTDEQRPDFEAEAVALFEGFEGLRQLMRGGLTQVLLPALAQSQEAEVLGREIVAGLGATQYLAQLEAPSLANGPLTAEVWVGDDGFVRRIETIFNATGAREAAEVSIDLETFGDVPPDLTPHRADTVTFDEFQSRQAVAESEKKALTMPLIKRLSKEGAELFAHPVTGRACLGIQDFEYDEGADESVEVWFADCTPLPEGSSRVNFCAAADGLSAAFKQDPSDVSAFADSLQVMDDHMTDEGASWTQGALNIVRNGEPVVESHVYLYLANFTKIIEFTCDEDWPENFVPEFDR